LFINISRREADLARIDFEEFRSREMECMCKRRSHSRGAKSHDTIQLNFDQIGVM
jgi:hypothetical protein